MWHAWGRREIVCRVLVGKPEGKRLRRERSIEMDRI
jgi:hypothetical protein